uniref:SGNH hydrolase domain-containing protein n=1 Tax=Proteus terrae TaxID=1574161 RepID=UPI00301CE74E
LLIISNEANNKNPYKCMEENKFPCYIGNSNNIKAIIVGDSHADALTTSLASVFNLNSEGIIALTKSSCPLILNMKSVKRGDECLQENIKRMVFLEKNYPDTPIFWVARTGAYLYGQTDPMRINSIADTKPSIYFSKKYIDFDHSLLNELEDNLNKTIVKLSKNRKVYLVLPTPEMKGNVPKVTAQQLLLGGANIDLSIEYENYYNRNKLIIDVMNNIEKNNKNVKTLDPTPYLCNKATCIALYNKRPIYYDGDHMSEYGNKLLSPMFKNVIQY